MKKAKVKIIQTGPGRYKLKVKERILWGIFGWVATEWHYNLTHQDLYGTFGTMKDINERFEVLVVSTNENSQ